MAKVFLEMDGLNELLLYVFGILNIFAFLGLILREKGGELGSNLGILSKALPKEAKNLTQNELEIKKRRKGSFCPCKKMAESGLLSTICMYLAMGGFLYSATSLSLIGFANLKLDFLLILSLICAYLGFKLKVD